MNTCEPKEPLQPFIANACCLAAAIGAYAALTLSIVGEGPGNYAVFKSNAPVQMTQHTEHGMERADTSASSSKQSAARVDQSIESDDKKVPPPSQTKGQSEKSGGSQYVKSNQFMLKDALCNFTNGELVCHRATGLRHLSLLSGS